MIIPFLFQVTGLEPAYNYFWSMSCMEKCAWVKGLLSPFLFFTPRKETQT